MNVGQAMRDWDMSEEKVYKICKALNIPKGCRGYSIPDDMKKPYFPDCRPFLKKNKLHVYIHVLNAIADELLIIPSLIGTDDQHVRTAVRELKKTDAIVVLDGAEEDLNYQNYMIGVNYADWTLHNVKKKMELVTNIFNAAKDIKRE